MKYVHSDAPDVEISIANYELLSEKYKPVILATIKKVEMIHEGRISKEDLYQEGLIALWDSIINFNKDKGVFFGVYLKVAIKNRLLCYCRNVLPHYYKKDPANPNKFLRIKVNVDNLDDVATYNL